MDYNIINYHLTNRCNYLCTYCFGKFSGQPDPALEQAKQIIDRIDAYFKQCGIDKGRINLAGGEPTLYRHLDELIGYIHSLGLSVSLVTNGSVLTAERIKAWEGLVSCVGISVDSVSHDTNITIGRCCNRRVIDASGLIELAEIIHECGIKLKINTVVSRLNADEDLSNLYRALAPEKIKLFQMHLVKGINDSAEQYAITKEEYDAFCSRYSEFKAVMVCEPYGSMENSYLMINPNGDFQLNDNGRYRTFGSLITSSLCEILEEVPLDPERFGFRYAKEDAR